MELTKNIFFNTDKLVENTRVKISYTGQLFQDNSKEVSIHYGFGDNWDNVNDVVMEKTDLGFQAEIILGEGNTFNFCFKDENDNWDNNNGQNYIFNLEKLPTELLVLYKIITYLPKIISGNYKKKATNNNEEYTIRGFHTKASFLFLKNDFLFRSIKSKSKLIHFLNFPTSIY